MPGGRPLRSVDEMQADLRALEGEMEAAGGMNAEIEEKMNGLAAEMEDVLRCKNA